MSRLPATAVVFLMLALPCAAQSVPRGPDSALRLTRHRPLVLMAAWPRIRSLSPGPRYSTAHLEGWQRPDVGSVQTPPDRWLAPDKLKHFFLSFGATGFAFAGARASGAGNAADWLAPSAAMAAGVLKEIADDRHGWGFSLRDLVWDAAGAGAAMLVMSIRGGA